eukprot:TRINITY_DN2486_c0_g1_i1.p1 TRINITY_DN2486_c0_g1~~TRINITY_DN2486_c0_g1_i1.p1  ORF type:complete len:842 (+),score=195.48 TRINITY_DN2486_c0_g1_i1:1634-4159(+)
MSDEPVKVEVNEEQVKEEPAVDVKVNEKEDLPFAIGEEVEAYGLKGLAELNEHVGKVIKMQGDRVVVEFGGKWGEKALKIANLKPPGLTLEETSVGAAVIAALAVGIHECVDEEDGDTEAKISEDAAYISSLLRKATFTTTLETRIIEQKEHGATQCLAHVLDFSHIVFECPFCEVQMGVRYASQTEWLRCNSCKSDRQLDICLSCAALKKDLEVSYHPNDHTFTNLSKLCQDNREAVVCSFKQNLRDRLRAYPIKTKCRSREPILTRQTETNALNHKATLNKLSDGRECDWCGTAVGARYRNNQWFKCNQCTAKDFDMCGWCFEAQYDLSVPQSDLHREDHTFSNLLELLPEAVPATPPTSPERRRAKAIYISEAALRETFAPLHYCPQCGAPYDVANPYNPRKHPNKHFGACDLEVRIEGAKPQHICGICNDVVKWKPGAVALSHRQEVIYCGDCLIAHVSKSRTVPGSGDPIPEDASFVCFQSIAIELAAMYVPCLYCSEPCPLHAYEQHVSTCAKRTQACKYRTLACPYTARLGDSEALQQHEEGCIHGAFKHYITRNELQKREMEANIEDLKEMLEVQRQQISLLVREKNFVYSADAFEEVTDEEEGEEEGLEILHCKNRAAIAAEKVMGAPRQTWSEAFKGSTLSLSADKLTCKGGGKVQTVLGTLPMAKPGVYYWEVLISGMPSCGSVRVGLARNPPTTSHTVGLDLSKPLGATLLSWGWYSSGTFVHDQEPRLDALGEPTGNRTPLLHNEDTMRFTSKDFIGFLLDCNSGELFMYRNRICVGKHVGMEKKIVDPHSKKKSDPVYFAAASPGFGHHSVTLRPNAPMQKKPKQKK